MSELNEIVYRRVIVRACDSDDGKTPTALVVTKESNGYAVWLCDYDGTKQITYVQGPDSRETAIERAVAEVEFALNALK